MTGQRVAWRILSRSPVSEIFLTVQSLVEGGANRRETKSLLRLLFRDHFCAAKDSVLGVGPYEDGQEQAEEESDAKESDHSQCAVANERRGTRSDCQ
jgi:hypothetical protein